MGKAGPSKTIVRFAPSPTGHLHIGGARTALFNYLFARHHKGKFILRIEDTDKERSKEEYLEYILKGMEWLGLDWDDKPIKQSERDAIYREHVQKLLSEGKAYRCYCTSEELQAKRETFLKSGQKPKYDGTCRVRRDRPDLPFCIRFKAPQEGTLTFEDICRGKITINREEMDDLIIARTDGSATYNFTVVVDDALMGITHIIRGDDHLNNTPRQIQLYEAFGFDVPQFAHLPMIHGPDKKKLSKRHGAVSVVEYQEKGFLPEAMMNYLARLGWSSGDQEIFTQEELIAKFDLEGVGKSPAIFDIEKCTWVNSQHLLKKSDAELVTLTRPYLEALNLEVEDNTYAAKALRSNREKAKTLKELAEISVFYFQEEVVFDELAVAKWLNDEGKKHLALLKTKLEKLENWNEEGVKQCMEATLAERNIKKFVQLAQPCRVALTGSTVSPGIYEVIVILGKQKTLRRFEKALC